MRVLVVPMLIIVYVGLRSFLNHHLTLLPLLCIVVFILCFILLIKWNVERLRGN
jgi:hypothetical protein